MSPIQNVAIAGPGSVVAQSLIPFLLEAGFAVTALTRAGSTSNTSLPANVKVVAVDYADPASLTAALQGQDAVVSALGSAFISAQETLIAAAIASGVKRIVPSEYGCDLSNSRARALPVFATKVKIEEDLEVKVKGTGSSYTFVYNNAFLDWGIERNFLIDLKGKKIELFDGGDKPFTATPVPLVAKAIVGVLQKEGETKNRGVRVHGTRLTQKKFLEIAQKVVGEEGWEISQKESAEAERVSFENLKKDPGNVPGWVLGFLKRAIHGEGFGGDFSESNDNALLGLKELDEAEVEAIFRKCAGKLS